MALHTVTDWPFASSSISTLRWRISQACLIGLAHSLSNIYLRCFQQVQTKNFNVLTEAVMNRQSSIPLVTISNHKSCIDDPVICSLLPFKGIFQEKSVRWLPAAKEVCFINKFVSSLCARIRLVPVIRGDGVYQKCINFCVEKLNKSEWVHIYPEGKVNVDGDRMRLKWGIGQLIAEAKTTPIVIPFYHFGMDSLLPNRSPYIPRFFKKLTVLVGEPIDFSSLLDAQDRTKRNAVLLRRQITEIIQEKLADLRVQAEALHNDWNPNFVVSKRTL